jgi:hypothetical protein
MEPVWAFSQPDIVISIELRIFKLLRIILFSNRTIEKKQKQEITIHPIREDCLSISCSLPFFPKAPNIMASRQVF